MTDFTFSSVPNGSLLDFNAARDRLIFNEKVQSAADLRLVSERENEVSVVFADKTVSLKTSFKTLIDEDFVFQSGSVVKVGDNSTGVDADDAENQIEGTEFNDNLIGPLLKTELVRALPR